PKAAQGLILGGGGVTGIAWEVGLLSGLEHARIDLRRVDQVIGTSAGSFAAVSLLSTANLDDIYARQLEGSGGEVPAAVSPALADEYQRVVAAAAGDSELLGRLFGTIARNAKTISVENRMEVVRARLGTNRWPSATLSMTAIDAETGRLCLLDEASSLTLAEAAAASGAVPGIWPMVSAGGSDWIDGGMASPTNAQLGSRFARVVIIAPVPVGSSGSDVQHEVATLPSTTEAFVVTPDTASRDAIGPNVFDTSRLALVAASGRKQGTLIARELSEFLRNGGASTGNHEATDQ
ncbi:MAG: h16, partial [Frondihabitans sp.]|nr:h16 [Frondihabitans sp.]